MAFVLLLLGLTVDLQVSFACGSSSGILGFAFVSSRVLQLNVGDFQHRLGLAEPRLFGDVAIYLPPCDCRHWTVTREERGISGGAGESVSDTYSQTFRCDSIRLC